MDHLSLASLNRDLPVSRRSLLVGAAAFGSCLVVGFSAESQISQTAAKPGDNPFVGYLQIAPDDSVTIYSS